jgi:KaiC/GvpD/RAD55 family RecA-like ATPase
MFEAKIMSAFIADRTDYDLAHMHIVRDDISPFGAALFDSIAEYYAADTSADHIDVEVLRLRLDRRFKDIPKHQAKMHDYLVEVLSVDTSTVNVVAEVIEQQRADIGTKLADALFAQDEERVEMLLPEYRRLTDARALESNVEDEYSGVTLDQLEEQFDEDGAWQLAPRELGLRIKGGLRAGHAVVVAARPERGKTLFGVNFAAGFLHQGAKVLYIGNEDPIPDLVLRLLSNLTGMTEDEMFANKEEAMAKAAERGYDRIVFAGLSPGTLYDIEALVRRHEPDILIVDQMRNIRANTENNTQRLEIVAQEIRNMARRHSCVAISLTQVGDSGRDTLELNDGDIDGSNTGIPGACDVIVMIGSNDEFELRDLRRICLAKNKRGGDRRSFTVAVDRGLSRVTSYA